MSLNVELLRSSFELVIEREPQLVVRFYEILFERYPGVKPLFANSNQTRQAEMLGSALVAVLDHIEDASWLTNTLKGLGARHVQYGVTRSMYPAVSECLRAAMAEAAGAEWSTELDQAWADAISAISDLMLAGADEQAVPETIAARP